MGRNNVISFVPSLLAKESWLQVGDKTFIGGGHWQARYKCVLLIPAEELRAPANTVLQIKRKGQQEVPNRVTYQVRHSSCTVEPIIPRYAEQVIRRNHYTTYSSRMRMRPVSA